MKIIVNKHNLVIEKEPVNEKEINVSYCEFEFDEAITEDFVKEAYFTFKDKTYKQIINNNQCNYPSEILEENGVVEIGVVAYKVENEEEIIRYNPSPAYFSVIYGSLKEAENSEPITPSEMEQYMQLLEDGLEEVANVDIDLEQVEQGTKVIITNRNGKEKETTILNGKDGKDGVDGKDGEKGEKGDKGDKGDTGAKGDKGDKGEQGIQGERGEQGIQGIQGEQGQAGRDGYVQYEAGENISIIDNVISATSSGGIKELTESSYVKDLEEGVYSFSSNSVRVYLFGTSTSNYVNGYGYLFVKNGYGTTKYFNVILYDGNWNFASRGGSVKYVMITGKTSDSWGYEDDVIYLKQTQNLNREQTITAKKTFNILPESSKVPTTNNQLVNKSYVDGAIAGAITNALGGSY